MEKIHYYADAGHGWLRVPVIELIHLKIHKKITIHSYMRGRWVYLEEDLDAVTYLDAVKLRPKIVQHVSDGFSKIRKFDSFNVENWLQKNELEVIS